MIKAVLVSPLAVGLTWLYFALAATLRVAADRTLAPRITLLRILVSWLVPILGAILTIRVAGEESQQDLRARWLLWPLRCFLSEPTSDRGPFEVTDLRSDAERILPGHRFIDRRNVSNRTPMARARPCTGSGANL